MTMADTVAVMNQGRIEQMGAPVDIYDLPRTRFVATFLGQSNEVSGRVTGTSGGDLLIEGAGSRFTLPVTRSAVDTGDILVGVRPEKLSISAQGSDIGDDVNYVTGKVTDASFTGVSTQYLVMTSWGGEWMVFEQNRSLGGTLRPGDEVTVHWRPEHTFGLAVDGSAAESA
jgi:ABC-type spermidine/putrescine transport systems, ATPase components